MSNVLKIPVIGNAKVGKTTLANILSEYSNVLSQEYKPTVGLRILECEIIFTEDQIKSTKYLKMNNLTKSKIQLWDISGDKK